MNKTLRYVYAIVAVSLAVILRYLLVPLIGPGLPYVTLFPVTVSVALFAGIGPAILTGFLGGLAVDYFFIPPLFSTHLDIAHLARLGIVTLTSAFVGYMGDSLRAGRVKAEKQAMALSESEQDLKKARADLELRVQERTAELRSANKELEEEIAERWRAEEKIYRLNRLYSVLSKANEAIVRVNDTGKLYEQLCRIAVEDGLFKMAWIGLTDPDTQLINVVASFGDTGGYLDGIRVYAADMPEGKGPTGKAAFEGTYSVCSDIEHDPQMLPWRDKALQHGFHSSAAFPLRMGPVLIGAFTIYSDKPQFFTDEEIKLLSSLAEDVSFAIESMTNEKKRLQAEEALRQANVYNRSLIDASLDPLVTIDAGGKITDVNIATENVTGRSRNELIGADFSDYFTEPEKARAGYQRVFNEGLVKDYPLEIRHRDGRITPVLYNAAVYRDKAGKVTGVFAAARDITERRRAEELAKLDEERTNSILRISQYPAGELRELLDFALDEAIVLSGSKFGYLYFYHEDTQDFILHAWSKDVMTECTIADPQTDYKLEKTGVWGEVVRQRKPIIINDFPAPHPLKKGYPEGHAPLLRFFSVPVFSEGRIVAVVGFANRSAEYTDRDVSQITLLMDSVWKIVERRQAEEKLKLAGIYNRSLIEASLDPLVTIDAGGKITDVNIATENVTGRSRNELIGADFSDYFTEPEKARAGYQRVFNEGLVKDYPLEIRHRDGRVTPVLYNAAVYRDKAGKVTGVFAAARDISERRESERRLAVTNDLLKLYTLKFSRKEYLDVAVDLVRQWSGCRHTGIRIPDQDGNLPFEACAGYNSLFLDSEATLSLTHDHCLCTRVVLGAPQPQELASVTPNGSYYFNNTTEFVEGLTKEQRTEYRGVCMQNGFRSLALVPIRHQDNIVGAIHLADEREGLFSLDKIEFIEQLALIVGEAMFRFGIEEELHKLNRELEQRVSDRTAQLEAANIELEAFSYSVSHDLRAPLRSIDGFSQALLEDYDEKLDTQGKDFLQRVRSGSQRMAQLIDDLLNLSRVTRSDMNRGPVDLSALARKAADELIDMQPGRKVEFIIAKGVTAEGDDKLLYLVLENLLSNAWKFTARNPEARIEFGTLQMRNGAIAEFNSKIRNPKSEMEQTVYYIKDNGIGFDMVYSAKLGVPFQRLHSIGEFPGTGIGLATVKRIINRHGGSLWMEGEVGKGATAYFTL